MRITAANIPAPSSRATSLTSAQSTDQTDTGRQVQNRDSYRQSQVPPAPFIDAEYIEFYSPSPQTFQQERSGLDNTLVMDEVGGQNRRSENATAGKYQLKKHDAPPPGSFIDTFA